MYVYKTAGIPQFGVRPVTHDQSCTLLSTVRAVGQRDHLPGDVIHLKLSLNDSLFVVNTGMLLGFYAGFPNALTVSTFVLILGGGCLDGTPHPLLQAIFCLACFSKSTYECRPLCCWCCAEQDSSKVKTLDQLTHTHKHMHRVWTAGLANACCDNDSNDG